MADVGIGGTGYVFIAPETAMGTFVQPNHASALAVPILEESLAYTEDKYMSRQIRKSAIVSEVKQSYYHVEGDIVMEADPNYLPYFLHASRHIITKTGASAPFTYKYVPGAFGSAITEAGPQGRKTLSITVVRNGEGFGYAGCSVGRMEWTIEDGVLRVTFGIVGLSEEEPSSVPANPTWLAANLYGADSSNIFVDAAAVAPPFAGSPVEDFNGFTFTADYNAEAQNRIKAARSAAFVSYGENEATYDTELDFIDRAEYDNFVNTTYRAMKLQALHPGNAATLAAATDGVVIQINRSVYETYDVTLGALEELTMAGVTGRVVGIAGGDPFSITVKTPVDIL